MNFDLLFDLAPRIAIKAMKVTMTVTEHVRSLLTATGGLGSLRDVIPRVVLIIRRLIYLTSDAR